MVGIKGLRKKATDQIHEEGGKEKRWWVVHERIPNMHDHVLDYDPTDEAQAKRKVIVYEAILMDEVAIDSYARSLKRFMDMGMQLDEAQRVCGPYPKAVGYGIYDTKEKRDLHSKMNPVELAMKRAEAMAIKQRFNIDLEFSAEDGLAYEPPPQQNGNGDAVDQLHGYTEQAPEDPPAEEWEEAPPEIIEGTARPADQPNPKPKQEAKPTRAALSPEKLQSKVRLTAQTFEEQKAKASKEERTLLWESCKLLLNGVDEDCKLLLQYLTRYRTVQRMPDEMVLACLKWMGVTLEKTLIDAPVGEEVRLVIGQEKAKLRT